MQKRPSVVPKLDAPARSLSDGHLEGDGIGSRT